MTKKAEFLWTDDETELLFSVTHKYNVKKNSQGVNWESVRRKYKDILELFKDALPTTHDDVQGKDYCHDKDAITKSILSTKLNNIRTKFRQAVDTGKRGRHERVVIYFEVCERILGGSPATEQLDGGIESAD